MNPDLRTPADRSVEERITRFREDEEALRNEIRKLLVGQDSALRELTTVLLAGGHALVEGVPGTGKTMLVRALSESTGLEFRRVQFTPDLLPADILGCDTLILGEGGRERIEFRRGPIFTQFLLGIAYAAGGRHEQGATVLERATAQSGRSSFYLGLLGWTYGLADRREDAERLLEELAARRIAGYVPPFCDAWVHCGLGNTDRAFEWLDRSVAAHAFLQPLFPTYRAIGDDPRFDNIKKRMGLA